LSNGGHKSAIKNKKIKYPRVILKATPKAIKRDTRKKYSSEEKIRLVLEGLRGETFITELCRREGINPNVSYRWSKDFLEACKKRPEGDE
jgi:transposase